MVLLCCLMLGMLPRYNVYGAAFEDDLEEVREELGDSGEPNCTSDGFKYEIVTNTSTNKEEVVIVGYDALSAGVPETLVIPEKIEEKTVTALKDLGYINSTIKKIEIPAGISSIDVDTLRDCRSLTELNVDSQNAYYSSIDGILYDKAPSKLLFCPSKKEGTVTVPDQVKYIAKDAFRDCINIRGVTMPGVLEIGEGAFTRSGVYTLEISKELSSIGDSAFWGCYSLSIEVEEGNPKYCSENGMLFNKDKTELYFCPGGEGKVIIPSSVTHIGSAAFSIIARLDEVEVAEGNQNYSAENGMLFNKDKTELYFCLARKEGVVDIPPGVTKITENVFQDHDYITEVRIPAGVEEIEDLAFYHCGRLESVTLPDTVKRIGMLAFSWSPSLKKITIPPSVTEVGGKAFDNCTALTEATILPMKINIAKDVFMNSKYYPFIIHCRPGSDVEKFAKENGFKYDYNTGYDFPDDSNNEGIPGDGTGKPSDTPVNGETPSNTSANTIGTLTLNTSAIHFDAIGETENLTVLGIPQSLSVTWSSSNPSVAVVKDGTVTATGNGTAVITATAGIQSASADVTVSQRANKISLTLNGQPVSGTLKARVKKSYSFKAKVEPANADSKNKKVTWKSSNSKIATIKNGKVTIKKAGTVTITAKTGDGKTAKIKLKSAKNPVKVAKVSISGNKSMEVKSRQNLKLAITPATADNSKVTWSTSDKKIAQVDKNGKVTAKKKGTVTITAKAKDGSGKKGTIKIKVK